jgi:hypothetical protein
MKADLKNQDRQIVPDAVATTKVMINRKSVPDADAVDNASE